MNLGRSCHAINHIGNVSKNSRMQSMLLFGIGCSPSSITLHWVLPFLWIHCVAWQYSICGSLIWSAKHNIEQTSILLTQFITVCTCKMNAQTRIGVLGCTMHPGIARVNWLRLYAPPFFAVSSWTVVPLSSKEGNCFTVKVEELFSSSAISSNATAGLHAEMMASNHALQAYDATAFGQNQ